MDPVAADADLQTRVEEARDERPTEAIEIHPDDAEIPAELLASIKNLAESRG